MRIFGLIGYPLAHSQSPAYFQRKFENEHIDDARYVLFPLSEITDFKTLIETESDLCGLNVTTPYKSDVLPYLDTISTAASLIGAVNVIRIERGNGRARLAGYNSDHLGFLHTLQQLQELPQSALILGTGGAAKAVAYALQQKGISSHFVSRSENKSILTYSHLTKKIIQENQLIVQATPVGMWPHTQEKPNIPYEGLTPNHTLIDLIYNPEETKFLKEGKKHGAATVNGSDMLKAQAEASWEIWNRC